MRAAKAILKLRPGAEFSIDGDVSWTTDPVTKTTYMTNVDWHTEVQPITKQEYEAILPEVIAEEPKLYQFERARAYPALTELADAIYWQQQGDSSKMDAYLEKVQAVKDAYPKQ